MKIQTSILSLILILSVSTAFGFHCKSYQNPNMPDTGMFKCYNFIQAMGSYGASDQPMAVPSVSSALCTHGQTTGWATSPPHPVIWDNQTQQYDRGYCCLKNC